MINSTGTALNRGNALANGYGGLCLAFVSWCYGASAQYSSAIACWNGQSANNVATNDVTKIPVGAPIFFSQAGNPYGHVALYAGDGMMRTTYSPDNKIHTMSIALWISWGYVLLGYSKAIENQLIPDLNNMKTTTVTTVLSGKEITMTSRLLHDVDTGVVYYWTPELGRIGLGNVEEMKMLQFAGVGVTDYSKTANWAARADSVTERVQAKMKKVGVLK